MRRRQPRSTLFPYTTLFRSGDVVQYFKGGPQTTGRMRAHGRSLTSRPPAVCARTDRKSTRLNSSHITISYAVFCLKKKKKNKTKQQPTITTKTPTHNTLT